MAEGGYLAPDTVIRVCYGTREPQEISVKKTWTVRKLKQHIADELGIVSGEVDLMFKGKVIAIDDDARIEVRLKI